MHNCALHHVVGVRILGHICKIQYHPDGWELSSLIRWYLDTYVRLALLGRTRSVEHFITDQIESSEFASAGVGLKFALQNGVVALTFRNDFRLATTCAYLLLSARTHLHLLVTPNLIRVHNQSEDKQLV